MARMPAALLGHEVTLRMEAPTKDSEVEKQKEPRPLVSLSSHPSPTLPTTFFFLNVREKYTFILLRSFT